MRLAIVHYHLEPGGVTRVIHHILASLERQGLDVVVLTGKPPGVGQWSAEFRVIPGLLYEHERPPISAGELARQLDLSATEALRGRPDFYHVHNHSLGKNLALPGALCNLAARGYPMLLHIHDFAEDGRPRNYRLMREKMTGGRPHEMFRLLYPAGGHIHYGLLNSRDRSYLARAGAEDGNLHLLPNPVDVSQEMSEATPDLPDTGDRLVLYPTRAIRRKNIGEFLLLSATAPDGFRFATTLGPGNPVERPPYEHWLRVSKELGLPVTFELGRKTALSFSAMLQQAEMLITTSVAEGFGLAFLEPWLAQRVVIGRDLPEVTCDFRLQGIELPWLYERLGVPVDWFGIDRIAACGMAGLQHALAAYGRLPSAGELERLLAAWVQEGLVDFGRLNEEMQEVALRRIVREPGEAQAVRPATLPDCTGGEKIIARNCQILHRHYSLKEYGRSLLQCYNKVAESNISPLGVLDGEVLLDHFLAPERLSLLRVD